MAQTRMFRDRVVSMEQTLEGGEKHLELLKGICREALPEFEHVSHALDHERDNFVMELAAPDGRRRLVAWTRMVLFDAERIPTLSAGAGQELREKIVQHIRARAHRPEILVTFRHPEEGWVDTPAPKGNAAVSAAAAAAAGRAGEGLKGRRPLPHELRPLGGPGSRTGRRSRVRRAGGRPGRRRTRAGGTLSARGRREAR